MEKARYKCNLLLYYYYYYKIANNFNDFFTNIGTKLANKISPPDSDYVSPLKSKNKQNSMFLNPTNTDEIIKMTKNFKLSNSSGIDNISTKLLKMIINEIAPVLSDIFNRSLLSWIVPSQLKIAKVNPIFKSGDNQVFSNYRPSPYYLQSQKFLKKLCIPASLILLLKMKFSVLTNMVLGLTGPLTWP